ncbi:hypothetical protein OH76DRAFT_1320654, partial [Lentinus brumalis]
LLHIADAIETIGPVWIAWEWPMERFCGFLLRAVKNRRFPYAAIANYLVDLAQLTQIIHRY